jgi:SAM-dependent methyltransferase
VATKVLARFGMGEKVEFAGGDFTCDPLPQPFDVVWISQVLHQESPQSALDLVKKAVSVLEPGGLLAIQEFYIEDDKKGPTPSALFSLNMLINTPGGQSYTYGQIGTMMAEAGLKEVTRLKTQLPGGCGIMTAIKP